MSAPSNLGALVLVVMGVSGAGKTTVAKPLAAALGWPFKEGDDLHPPANIAKMSAGVALTDADRAPWLAAIGDWIDGQIHRGEPGVITCSALRRAYRDVLCKGRPAVRIVYLQGSREVIAARLAKRQGHFMPPSLLDSQLAALQPPGPDEAAIVVDINQTVEAQVAAVLHDLGRR